MIEKHIFFETKQGNKYKLSFVPYQTQTQIEIPVIEVSLDIIQQISHTNSMSVFSFVVKNIENFFTKNQVILYYYCDSSDIYYRNNFKRKFTSSQHFRSIFFISLFRKANVQKTNIANVVVEDILQKKHYISFIFHDRHKRYIEKLIQEAKAYGK